MLNKKESSILGFVDIEEKFNEFFEKFEEEKGEIKITSATSSNDNASLDNIEYV